jgi:hypothetical protein
MIEPSVKGRLLPSRAALEVNFFRIVRETLVRRSRVESKTFDVVCAFSTKLSKITTEESGQSGWVQAPYPKGSFDFVAACVIPEDAWYLIPERDSGVAVDLVMYDEGRGKV